MRPFCPPHRFKAAVMSMIITSLQGFFLKRISYKVTLLAPEGRSGNPDDGSVLSADNVPKECYPGEWPCPSSGLCIPMHQLCDGRAQCPDGEDETNATADRNCSSLDLNESFLDGCWFLGWLLSILCVHCSGIWKCASLSCEHRCHASPDGGTCSCPSGYIVSSNNSRSCIGI